MAIIVRRLAFIAGGLLLVALVAGAIYQYVATISDYSKYPPRGVVINVEGRGLHLNCSGEGSPTVILESGLGGGSLDWSLVQPDVSKLARVCSYDRAGVAWSDPGESPRTALRITDELHKALGVAHIAPPYVLVGHSMGGIYVQTFAARYPNDVAAVVLVDSSHQDQLQRLPGIPAFVPYLFKAAAPIGMGRIVNGMAGAQPNLTLEANAELAALYSRTSSIYATADEMVAIPESLQQLRDSPMELGDKPLIVLSRGLDEGGSPENEAIWRELQESLSKRSSNGILLIAARSGHYIQFFEPELVIDSIRRVLSAPAATAQ